VSEGAPRLDKAHPTTVKRAFVRAGIPVAARRPREKPLRPTKAKKARALWCKAHSHFKSTYFADDVDLIIDNKKFEIPTSERAQATREVPFAHTVGGVTPGDAQAEPEEESHQHGRARQGRAA